MSVVKIVGLDILKRRLLKMENDLRRREQVNQQATVIIDRWIQENFTSQGKLAMGGGGWRPLARATIEAKQRRWARGMGKKAYRKDGSISPALARKIAGNKILQDRGFLKTNWKHLWTPNLAKVQSDMPYASAHHKGIGHLPVRRILPLEKQIWPRLLKLFDGWVRKVVVR